MVCTADLAEPEGLGSAARLITDERPELLVLNAGFGLPEPFADCDPRELSRMLRVHVDHVVQLPRAYLKPPAWELSMVIVVPGLAYRLLLIFRGAIPDPLTGRSCADSAA